MMWETILPPYCGQLTMERIIIDLIKVKIKLNSWICLGELENVLLIIFIIKNKKHKTAQ